MLSVLYSESTQIIVGLSFDNILVFHFKLLNFWVEFVVLVLFRFLKQILLGFGLSIFSFYLHLTDSIGFEFFGDCQQLGYSFPIDDSLIVDELFLVFEVAFVAVEKGIHVVVFEGETKLNGEEVVADKGHQQDEVIDYLLDCTPFNCLQLFFKFTAEVLSDDVDKS